MSDESKVYLVRAGKYGEDEDLALDNGVAVIGFRILPDLNNFRSHASVLGALKKGLPDRSRRSISNLAGQVWTFSRVIKVGDLVVFPRKLTSQIAIGRVTGPYRHQSVGGELRHTLPVEWIRLDVPRTAFEQDLLYSFGSALAVCNISRNDADLRVAAVMAGKPDPGMSAPVATPSKTNEEPLPEPQPEDVTDLGQLAHDQIVAHIQSRFAGHALAVLVGAVLRADGWVTKVSSPGADGGVDPSASTTPACASR